VIKFFINVNDFVMIFAQLFHKFNSNYEKIFMKKFMKSNRGKKI